MCSSNGTADSPPKTPGDSIWNVMEDSTTPTFKSQEYLPTALPTSKKGRTLLSPSPEWERPESKNSEYLAWLRLQSPKRTSFPKSFNQINSVESSVNASPWRTTGGSTVFNPTPLGTPSLETSHWKYYLGQRAALENQLNALEGWHCGVLDLEWERLNGRGPWAGTSTGAARKMYPDGTPKPYF